VIQGWLSSLSYQMQVQQVHWFLCNGKRKLAINRALNFPPSCFYEGDQDFMSCELHVIFQLGLDLVLSGPRPYPHCSLEGKRLVNTLFFQFNLHVHKTILFSSS